MRGQPLDSHLVTNQKDACATSTTWKRDTSDIASSSAATRVWQTCLSIVGVVAAVAAPIVAPNFHHTRVVVACTATARIASSGRRDPPVQSTVATLTSRISATCFGVATATTTRRRAVTAVVTLTRRTTTSSRVGVTTATRTARLACPTSVAATADRRVPERCRIRAVSYSAVGSVASRTASTNNNRVSACAHGVCA